MSKEPYSSTRVSIALQDGLAGLLFCDMQTGRGLSLVPAWFQEMSSWLEKALQGIWSSPCNESNAFQVMAMVIPFELAVRCSRYKHLPTKEHVVLYTSYSINL